ncbi:DUF982 domain-containing protein [Mesorhizobium sp. M0152]|uniref:DUF982 domain-containing protein n=1 Tax=Mesorhizobium sp. M0152 TaxID=2956898 RepID=UPI00333BADE1
MSLHWFSPPVPVKTSLSHRYNVSSVEAAGEQLLKFTKRGANWRRAVLACMAFGVGKVSAQDVRTLFRLAAKEEGVLLSDRDD